MFLYLLFHVITFLISTLPDFHFIAHRLIENRFGKNNMSVIKNEKEKRGTKYVYEMGGL